MTAFLIIICPECESPDFMKDGDWNLCDRCGHRWRPLNEEAHGS